MRRLAIGAGIGLICLLMVGVVALIVVRVVTNGGESSAGRDRPSAGSGRPFAFRCPHRTMPKSVLAERNTNPQSALATVPKGADRMLLCRYGSPKQAPGPPVRERLVRDRNTIIRTATALNGVPASEEGMLCLNSKVVIIYAVFRYREADPVVVELRPYGCYNSTNGHVKGQYTVAEGLGPMMSLLGLPIQKG